MGLNLFLSFEAKKFKYQKEIDSDILKIEFNFFYLHKKINCRLKVRFVFIIFRAPGIYAIKINVWKACFIIVKASNFNCLRISLYLHLVFFCSQKNRNKCISVVLALLMRKIKLSSKFLFNSSMFKVLQNISSHFRFQKLFFLIPYISVSKI